ncbi:GPW/gp25 family protein [Lunatimonas lonarensis]|uniref:GPW/gp25 family protein n=1 Tax=Lunatimonas lonarensis TaxID=1232681 RepID=R7ZVW0_9BACT|nr:GPW/gp25 family protein [Lunatimonas lonarensis]EON78222.1 GPW/gp25 family protein [Lunatimonas lonarensis]
MNSEYAFLGRGWSFPPTFDHRTGEVELLSGEADIESSLEILLSTKLGERVMQPSYGCQLDELQFNPLNRTTVTYVSDLIETAILYHEPRIAVEKIKMQEAPGQPGVVLIELDYIIRSTNSRKNLVYPFYKIEANAR